MRHDRDRHTRTARICAVVYLRYGLTMFQRGGKKMMICLLAAILALVEIILVSIDMGNGTPISYHTSLLGWVCTLIWSLNAMINSN